MFFLSSRSGGVAASPHSNHEVSQTLFGLCHVLTSTTVPLYSSERSRPRRFVLLFTKSSAPLPLKRTVFLVLKRLGFPYIVAPYVAFLSERGGFVWYVKLHFLTI